VLKLVVLEHVRLVSFRAQQFERVVIRKRKKSFLFIYHPQFDSINMAFFSSRRLDLLHRGTVNLLIVTSMIGMGLTVMLIFGPRRAETPPAVSQGEVQTETSAKD